MGTDHGIRAGINKGMGAVDLLVFQHRTVLHAPVGKSNDIIGIFRRCLYGLQEAGIVITPENTRLRIGCLRCIDRIFCTGRRDIGDLESICLQIDRGGRLFYVPAGTDIGNLCFFKSLQCVQEGNLSKIEGMIVGKSDDIHTQVL